MVLRKAAAFTAASASSVLANPSNSSRRAAAYRPSCTLLLYESSDLESSETVARSTSTSIKATGPDVCLASSSPVPAHPFPPPQPPAAPPQPRMVMVRCLAGVGVGETMQFETEGRRFRVVVPAGVSPGQEFRVPLPS